ncbi:hypothetical protein [Spiroplasma eriocheiris]|uniref:Acetyltransferase n=1 Tax=Spiroplasma eriocheiris TaxID=315358 RepID=A0A0H3XN95_9MOLU|nr:hypothetical protein [Spiroplasma eriocheiris]AHF58222.1 hypothetical protein SPE_1108 [Spiroplasma eriocheiris CCTCC M 207170]AKM54657.1 hypothetical protein SERIO_v1c11040 [Spiroplasma eriocheiris]
MLFNKLKNKTPEEEDKKQKPGKHNLLQDEKKAKPQDSEPSNFFDDEEDSKDIKTGFSFKRRKTHKIIKNLNAQKIRTLLFYTDVSNVLRQLEFGIQPIKNIHLVKDSEYIVWTYLEKPDHIEFELDNSTRHYFWSWIAEQKVDPNQIAVIAIDIKKLFENTKTDWYYEETTRRVHLFEDVKPECIKWILMKNNEYLNRIQNYVKSTNLKIKVFQGEKGNIEEVANKNRKK